MKQGNFHSFPVVFLFASLSDLMAKIALVLLETMVKRCYKSSIWDKNHLYAIIEFYDNCYFILNWNEYFKTFWGFLLQHLTLSNIKYCRFDKNRPINLRFSKRILIKPWRIRSCRTSTWHWWAEWIFNLSNMCLIKSFSAYS